MGKEDIDFVFEPQRGQEKDEFGSGLNFNLNVGPKVAIAVAAMFANLFVSVANTCIRLFFS